MSDAQGNGHSAPQSSQAASLAQSAKDRVEAEAEYHASAARDTVADEAQTAADAANAAADQFDPRSIQAQATQHIADQIEGVAAKLRSADLETVVSRTSDFARRNPLLFVGGAAALGFAATRFLKARDPAPHRHAMDDDPWHGGSGMTAPHVNGGLRHG